MAFAFAAALWSGVIGGPAYGALERRALPTLLAQVPTETAAPAPPQTVTPMPPETPAPMPPETPVPMVTETPAAPAPVPPETSAPMPSETPVPEPAPVPAASGVSSPPAPPSYGEPHRGVPRGPIPPAHPAPAPSGSPLGRFHLHRPGTDVDGDLLTGSLASQAYILKGNVTLHSDPKIDREIADASESEEPLTVTADEIDVDRLGYSYVAKGHVHFVQGVRSGRANLATLNEQTHSLDLVGDANVYEGDHRTVADRFHYDMLDKSFHGSGDVRIFEPLPTPAPSVATPAPKHKRRLPL